MFKVSARNKYEKKELNKGEKDKRGIVKLNSDSFIDLRKIKAENIPNKTKVKPGKKYGVIKKLKLSFIHHIKKIIICRVENNSSNILGFMTFKLIFLVRSNRAQNIPEMRQINIDDDKIYSKLECSVFYVFLFSKNYHF